MLFESRQIDDRADILHTYQFYVLALKLMSLGMHGISL